MEMFYVNVHFVKDKYFILSVCTAMMLSYKDTNKSQQGGSRPPP